MAATYRALIVDDERVAREAAVLALEDEGFQCECAGDGAEAAAAIDRTQFDVVVTDLKMPRRNGHALAIDVIGRGSNRPLVVVLTGILEPRLVKDLVARGVDDVAFKPVDFGLFGAKVRALCERRRRRGEVTSSRPTHDSVGALPGSLKFDHVTTEQIEEHLDSLAGTLPVSQPALEVARLIREGKPSSAEIAQAIARDPLLTVEVLRLANSAHCHPAGSRIDNLQQAVTWVGDRQISELALASTTCGALAKTKLPWIDSNLLWHRSLASGLAVKQLHPAADLGGEDEGLFLSSRLLPLSRVLLGLAFPDLYAKMVAHCQSQGSSLASLERHLLPMTPARAMAGILARWHLSPGLCKPLQHAGLSYGELASLTEPLRSKVERLRVAELMGQLATGRFETWDDIDIPPTETICRLRTEDLASTVEQIRSDLPPVQLPKAKPDAGSTASQNQHPNAAISIRYFKLSADSRDLLATFIQSLNMKIERVSRDAACQPRPVLVNCLDVSRERLEWFLDDTLPDSRRILVCNATLPAHCESWGPVIQLPNSFHALAKAIYSAATHV